MIEPLEQKGILVRRSRERLETEINHFTIMERDGMIIGCAALYPYIEDTVAELACLAVHKDYQHEDRGETLLKLLEQQAIQKGIHALFVLTSQTAHWFIERGFKQIEITKLPVSKQLMYNYQRKSKVFMKELSVERI